MSNTTSIDNLEKSVHNILVFPFETIEKIFESLRFPDIIFAFFVPVIMLGYVYLWPVTISLLVSVAVLKTIKFVIA